MNKWIISGAIAAFAAGTAIAQMPMGDDMKTMKARAPETRAEAEGRVKARFAEVDANKDGVVTHEEIEAQRAAMVAKAFDKMFDTIDANHDGSVSREEFSAHHARMTKDGGAMTMGMRHDGMAPPPAADGAKPMTRRIIIRREGGDMFARADANGDGKVTLDEARAQALAAFDRADANKDGTLTPEERMSSMRKMGGKRVVEKRVMMRN